MRSFRKSIVVSVLSIFALGAVGCEYYKDDESLPPEGPEKTISEATKDSESYKSLEAKIIELQSAVETPPPSASDEELNALKEQIAQLQAAIEALKENPPGPADDGDTTGGGDTTGPTVKETAPKKDATKVSKTSNMTVSFSEEIDSGSVSGSSLNIEPSVGIEKVQVLNKDIVFVQLADMQVGTKYTVTVKKDGVKNMAGNPMAADYPWSFTTKTAAEVAAANACVTAAEKAAGKKCGGKDRPPCCESTKPAPAGTASTASAGGAESPAAAESPEPAGAVQDIRVYFQTGKFDGSGTNAGIDIEFCPSPAAFGQPTCHKFTIDPDPNKDSFENGSYEYVMASNPEQMKPVGSFNIAGLTTDDIKYLRVINKGGGDHQPWLLNGIKVEAKVNDNWQLLYANPAVHRWLNSNEPWQYASFGPADTAVLAVIHTGDVNKAGTDDTIRVYLPKEGSIDPATQNQMDKQSKNNPHLLLGTGDEIYMDLGWNDHVDDGYDDFEKNDRTAYGSYFYNDDPVQKKFRIWKEADGDNGGWRLGDVDVYIYHPGSQEFLADKKCYYFTASPNVWIEDDTREYPTSGYKNATLTTGGACNDLLKISCSAGSLGCIK